MSTQPTHSVIASHCCQSLQLHRYHVLSHFTCVFLHLAVKVRLLQPRFRLLHAGGIRHRCEFGVANHSLQKSNEISTCMQSLLYEATRGNTKDNLKDYVVSIVFRVSGISEKTGQINVANVTAIRSTCVSFQKI